MPRTKIVCTIGPASRSPEMLERLIDAGMDVARLNFSHGTQDEHREVLAEIRRIAERRGRAVAVLQDLAGLKIRIGEIASGAVTLQPRSTFTLTTREVPGSAGEVSVPYAKLTEEVHPGDTLLLSDGDLELEVLEVTAQDVRCRVITGGTLASRKGVSFPFRSPSAPTLTEKDREDLAFGLRSGVDFIALSFVRSGADILEARRTIRNHGGSAPLIAKIETHESLANIDEILEGADGIMVARGDLGMAIPLATVPRTQKMLIEKANRAGKPVIIATQMLRSMQDSPRPTRAEVTDVANAVLDGTDAVMLSEETAVGSFPVEAVAMMAAIAGDAESIFRFEAWRDRFDAGGEEPEAVARSACMLAADIAAAAIITCTESGRTAQRVAQYRPRTPILAPTPHDEVYRRLALIWGVTPLRSSSRMSAGEVMEGALQAAREAGHLHEGDAVVITAGAGGAYAGTTNLIQVKRV